jgi:hypothetical protein
MMDFLELLEFDCVFFLAIIRRYLKMDSKHIII